MSMLNSNLRRFSRKSTDELKNCGIITTGMNSIRGVYASILHEMATI
jgi:hypothetical protein